MSQIEKLITDLAPAGVIYKQLWEITTWDKRFNAVDNSKQPRVKKYHYLLASELKPLISEEGTIRLLTTNTSDVWTTEELAGDKVSNGEVIAIPWGGNPNVQYYNGKFLTADNRIAVSNDTEVLNTKYLYYYLLNNLDLLGSFYRGSGIKHPSMAKVLDMKIPLPPISIQRSIVKMLDSFIDLESELKFELKTRHGQYDHYRNKLFDFENEEVQILDLGELARFTYGFTTKAKDTGQYRFLRITDITDGGNLSMENPKYVDDSEVDTKYLIKKGDLLVARTGATYGKTLYVDSEMKAVYASFLIKIDVNNDVILPRYYWHFTKSSSYWNQANNLMNGGGQPQFNANVLKKLKVPVPSLEAQKNIIAILDRFDKLVYDTSEGLPAEISARSKQYEYYRHKLIAFQELPV